jgi:hypothetical protein
MSDIASLLPFERIVLGSSARNILSPVPCLRHELQADYSKFDGDAFDSDKAIAMPTPSSETTRVSSARL